METKKYEFRMGTWNEADPKWERNIKMIHLRGGIVVESIPKIAEYAKLECYLTDGDVVLFVNQWGAQGEVWGTDQVSFTPSIHDETNIVIVNMYHKSAIVKKL